MKFVVSYIIERYFQAETGSQYRPEGHSLIVQGDNRVHAFIAAYEQLTAQGHLVCTVFSLDTYEFIGGNGENHHGVAGLSTKEMEEVYQAGVPKNRSDLGYAMAHIEEIHEFNFSGDFPKQSPESDQGPVLFVDANRMEQLKAISASKFDLSKLVRLCEELNLCYANRCYLAVAMLTRTILDHIPPVFGYDKFAEVVNNYSGTKSFKEQMEHLHTSSRKIADSHLHTPIRSRESLPSQTQVNFANDLDVLLAEIIRIS